MPRNIVIYFLALPMLGQGLSVDEITRILETNPEYSKVVAAAPGTRPISGIRDILSAEELEFSSLVQRRLGLAVTPAEAKALRKDIFAELFKKLIAPTTGAAANSTGSTSAVAGTGIPMVIGPAFERGGITQSTKGTVLTLKGNLLGLTRGIGASDAYCLALECGQKEDVLRRVTFGVGFDMSRTANETGVGIDTTTNQAVPFSLRSAKEQFDHFTARVDLSNRRDIRGSYFQKEWTKNIQTLTVQTAGKALGVAVAALIPAQTIVTFRGPLETKLQNAASALQMAEAINEAVTAAAKSILATETDAAKRVALQKAHDAYATLVDEVARAAAQKFSHSVEYTFTRPKNQPEISNVRYVGSGGFGTQEQWRATLNAAADFYHQLPAGTNVGTFRDIQLSAQLDRVFFAKEPMNVTFSAAGYFQWMRERAVIVIGPGEVAPGTNIPIAGQAATLLAPEGNIGLGQLKLTFGVRDTKFKFPLSFTFANRTELIKPTKTILGGQFGISYDFDSLFKQ